MNVERLNKRDFRDGLVIGAAAGFIACAGGMLAFALLILTMEAMR